MESNKLGADDVFLRWMCLLGFISEEAEPEDSEEPFVAPPGLAIPPDVELVSNKRPAGLLNAAHKHRTPPHTEGVTSPPSRSLFSQV